MTEATRRAPDTISLAAGDSLLSWLIVFHSENSSITEEHGWDTGNAVSLRLSLNGAHRITPLVRCLMARC